MFITRLFEYPSTVHNFPIIDSTDLENVLNKYFWEELKYIFSAYSIKVFMYEIIRSHPFHSIEFVISG